MTSVLDSCPQGVTLSELVAQWIETMQWTQKPKFIMGLLGNSGMIYRREVIVAGRQYHSHGSAWVEDDHVSLIYDPESDAPPASWAKVENIYPYDIQFFDKLFNHLTILR